MPLIRLPTLGGSRDSGIGGLASDVASPVTKHDDRLLDGLPPGSPMEVGLSWALGSGRVSSCGMPMSLGSPAIPRAGCGGILKRLVDSSSNPTAFVDATKHMQKEAERKQLEEEESKNPAGQEDSSLWIVKCMSFVTCYVCLLISLRKIIKCRRGCSACVWGRMSWC